MDMIVAIARRPYERLLAACRESRREYQWLKNGIAVTDSGSDEVHVRCDEDRAQRIMNLVASKAPEIVSAIRLRIESI